MEDLRVSQSPYYGKCIILTTKHEKGIAIGPAFQEKLGAGIIEYHSDTDIFGTFTGEIEREANALETVRRKCELGLKNVNADYAIANEGSFGPHPALPMIPCGHEIMYFIDRKRGLNLHLSHITEKTNYATTVVDSWDALQKFAHKAGFPSHALIIRPNEWIDKTLIFKGVNDLDALNHAFNESRKFSPDKKVFVTTDMRAHLNPTRMKVINTLAANMAERLACLCPHCKSPGWGKVRCEPGLDCAQCGNETTLIKNEIFGCNVCSYEVTSLLSKNNLADPMYCIHCFP